MGSRRASAARSSAASPGPVRTRQRRHHAPLARHRGHRPPVLAVPARSRRLLAMASSSLDGAALRAVQQPLKDAYRQNPAEALVTLRAAGQLGEESLSCSVATGRSLAEAGLHPASGGDGSLACSGDMLLQALVACAGVTLRAVATSLGIAVATGT